MRRALSRAVHAAARKKDSYLRSMYYRLARRCGAGRAALAVSHSILEIIYHLIARDAPYEDLGADHLERHNAKARIHYLTRELEKLDIHVTIKSVQAAA